MVGPDSYIDLLLPSTANHRARLRLHDITELWIQAIDHSAHPGYAPEGDALLEAPYGAFDTFELDETFIIGRDHNPDNLSALNSLTVSREHLSLRVSLGSCGLILAIKDLGSHNGTEIVTNDTLVPYLRLEDRVAISR